MHPTTRALKRSLTPEAKAKATPYASASSLFSTRTIPNFELNATYRPILADPRIYTNLLTSLSKQAVLFGSHHPFDETPLRDRFSKSCKTLHARVLKLELRLSGAVGNALVDAYSKCGHVCYSRRVFDRLEARDAAAWNSVLSAHSRHGLPDEVLHSFRSMRLAGAQPDQFGFAIALSACARLTGLVFGQQVHCDVVRTGFESSSFCEGSLIDMYSKCDCVADARKVFDGINNPDIVSWTNMIAGYARIGMCYEAVELFAKMEKMGGVPDQVALVTTITALLSLGRLNDAQALFWQMPLPNTVAWNVMISGHAQHGHEVEALSFFKEMRGRDVEPTRSTIGSVLSAAANLMALTEGQQVHSEAIRFGLDSNVFVGSSLVNLYAKCIQIEDARKVFDFLDAKNIVMWNAMLGGYIQNGYAEEVMLLFSEMKMLDFESDEFTFVSVFGACASLENLNLGRQLHSFTVKNKFVASLFVGNAILDMYAKCGELSDARRQFECIPNRDIVSWNAIIVGLVHNEEESDAFSLFHRMLMDEVQPDEISFASVISACSNLQAFEKGKQIHCCSIKSSFSSNLYVASSLVDFYSKHGEIEAAKRVYRQMHERSVVSTNALIAGLVQNNNEEEALEMFRKMQVENLEPSEFTFSSILPACSQPSRLIMGKQVHGHLLKSGLLYDSSYLGTSLLDMYLNSKEIEDGKKLFWEMPERKSMVLWTAIISGHAQIGYSDDALLLFHDMRSYNVKSDESTLASVLKACADLAALRNGKMVHSLIIRTGFGSYEHTTSGLIDMYSKCGEVGASLQVFQELGNKEDIISWNSMIVSFAKNGYAEEALELFQQMEQLQIKPDDITFLGVLTACSHAGLVSKGHSIFGSMTTKYGITPRVDHHACMIDLLGRSGYLNEAEELIDELPFEPDGVIWATLLAACRMHGDETRAKRAADKLIELDPLNSSPYILLSNIYSASGDWSRAKMMRKAMRERGVRKLPGFSWITVGKETVSFVAGDKLHPDAIEICGTLKHLTAEMKEDYYVDSLSLGEVFG
ncbi:unnamed protein product [Musa acuminata subsp. malaccensis]|uniref:(wild Malaysian banana) hypothetical protein n=1 Tax=Musa acuminata subsp. malaccensis TaxID=214687 RepID=A0A804IUZ6_MUSAM|nr:PREDICTED: pentatricopeptide repeat-containing protein At3g09040, mitochondrial [Musa acuminata subsp. malaccensis]CAG1843665.1 unnamed protein product [Musa acuminata subsp. malaccensis]